MYDPINIFQRTGLFCAHKALFLGYVCCQRCELRVSKSLMQVVSPYPLSLNHKGLKGSEALYNYLKGLFRVICVDIFN